MSTRKQQRKDYEKYVPKIHVGKAGTPPPPSDYEEYDEDEDEDAKPCDPDVKEMLGGIDPDELFKE